MDWRAYGINSNGTVKLIKTDAINIEYNNNAYVMGETDIIWGFTYKEVPYNKTNKKQEDVYYPNSNLDNYVTSWYNETLKNTEYDNRILNATYCSNELYRIATADDIYYREGRMVFGLYATATKAGEYEYYYYPNISCKDGASIERKAALMTAEEVAIGGLAADSLQAKSYLFTGYGWWLMGPAWYDQNSITYKGFAYSVEYGLSEAKVTWNNGLTRPVITLKKDVTILSGNGSEEHPYVIE